MIGMIGQGRNGIVTRGTNDINNIIVKSLITALNIDLADEIGDLVLSSSRVVLPEDPDWIVFMEYNLPANIYASKMSRMTEISFKQFDLTNIQE